MAPRRNPGGGRKPGPIKTAIPILREMLEIADQRGISMGKLSLMVNCEPNRISEWRAGKHSPTAISLLDLAGALKLKLVIEHVTD